MAAQKPAGVTGRQPGHPNLKSGAEGFKPGKSGNPSGVSKYQRDLRLAIEKAEPAANVCAVIAAMREDALAHKMYSASAAKVYLGAVGVRLDGAPPVNVDLSDAPDEVVNWLADHVN